MSKRVTLPSLALLSVLMAGALVGCGGSSSEDSGAAATSDSGGSAAEAPAQAAAPSPPDPDLARGSAAYSSSVDSTAKNRVEPGPEVMQRAVIRKGNVELRSGDVGKAQAEVEKLVNRYFGTVTEEKTTTDDDGKPAYTNMVLRIPTAKFGDAMEDLKGTAGAELVSANSSEDDVTTKLIDTQTRLAAQKRSIARITVLFDRAQSIRDIMAIEAELSRRQAELDSLERQAAFLHGQTSMSTITVTIDQTPAKVVKKAEDDKSGFFAGLSAGWDALKAFLVGLATALGALLPWLVLVGIVGPPVYLLVRTVRRRITAGRSGRTPSAA